MHQCYNFRLFYFSHSLVLFPILTLPEMILDTLIQGSSCERSPATGNERDDTQVEITTVLKVRPPATTSRISEIDDVDCLIRWKVRAVAV